MYYTRDRYGVYTPYGNAVPGTEEVLRMSECIDVCMNVYVCMYV